MTVTFCFVLNSSNFVKDLPQRSRFVERAQNGLKLRQGLIEMTAFTNESSGFDNPTTALDFL